jgi:hypothetical protein
MGAVVDAPRFPDGEESTDALVDESSLRRPHDALRSAKPTAKAVVTRPWPKTKVTAWV